MRGPACGALGSLDVRFLSGFETPYLSVNYCGECTLGAVGTVRYSWGTGGTVRYSEVQKVQRV